MSSEFLVSPIGCPSSWRLVRLKDISTKIGSGATPTGGQAAYQEQRTNYALVRSQNVFDREFSDAGLAFISDEQATGLRNVRLSLSDFLCVEVMRRYRKKRPYDRNKKHDQEEQEIERAEAVSG
ncbi:hypothetical protein KB879_27305 [Cupriavidus sp. KK10]|uniref:hypothetical protein n=1 Tax=Cupriavidus sp. KK10 TaxID=1478019 RepID=UPI001BA62E8E|nr:hypothetical protein [Cupriavidus sp. KK10]QUN27723.1 hypothetical protein KB879_27305 [Cupriavidus sp. KK10]